MRCSGVREPVMWFKIASVVSIANPQRSQIDTQCFSQDVDRPRRYATEVIEVRRFEFCQPFGKPCLNFRLQPRDPVLVQP